MGEHYPKSLETTESVLARAKNLENDIRTYLNENNHLKHRVAVVGHNMMLRVLTTTEEFWQRGLGS